MSEMKRLQRWEIVYKVGLYSEYRELQRAKLYVRQQPDDCGEWCNAEDVAKLEDSHAELLRALRALYDATIRQRSSVLKATDKALAAIEKAVGKEVGS